MIEKCIFCGVKLNVTSNAWECTCGRVYEYAEIVTKSTPKEISGLGLYYKIKKGLIKC